MALLFVAIVIVALGAYLVLRDRAKQERIAQRRLEEGVKRRDQQIEERRKQERQGQAAASAQRQETRDAYENNRIIGEYRRLKSDLRIDYVDREGNATTRDITTNWYEINESGTQAHISAHCHLRAGNRSFYTNRIKRCVDLSTGEVIGDVARYLAEKYESSPEGIVERVVRDHSDEFSVLVYIGKADGALRKKEKDAISRYMIKVAGATGITVNDLSDSMKNLQACTQNQFKRAVGRLCELDADRQKLVLTTAEEIAGTKKEVKTTEQEAIDYLRKRLTAL